MSEIFSKNVIINKSDTILMQGNGIFLLGSLDMACETHRSTNIFEDCESAKHVAIWYQRGCEKRIVPKKRKTKSLY